MPVKISMFFSDGIQGFSESHYVSDNTVGVNTASYAKAKALALQRVLGIDGANVTLIKVRTSVFGIPRLRYLLLAADLPKKGVNGFYPGGIQADGVTWIWQTPHASWVVDINSQGTTSNPTLYYAGMPAKVGQRSNQPYDSPAPTPGSILDPYYTLLCNGDYGAMTRTWPTDPPTVDTSTTLSAVAFAYGAGGGPNTLTFTCVNPNSFPVIPAGSYVRLWGAQWTSPIPRGRYNGSYKVLTAGANSVQVAADRIKVPPLFTVPGYVQVSSMTFQGYLSYELQGLTHRDRGRPIGAARGRR